MPNITVSNEIFAELEKLGDEFTSSSDPDIFILDTPEKVIGHLLFMALRNEENKMPKQNEQLRITLVTDNGGVVNVRNLDVSKVIILLSILNGEIEKVEWTDDDGTGDKLIVERV